MAPAAAASLLSASSSKRPAAPSDADPILQGDQLEEARKNHHHQQQLDCPRCGSGNTKFCYYNNYSTAQPRHFCRACRRYWTHGGTLRNVPVGGACRRAGAGNKRRRVGGSSSSSSAGDQQSPTSARAEADAYYHRDLPTAVGFPFLSDSFFLPQFDLGLGGAAPAPFTWTSASDPDFYDGLASPWSDGTLATGVTGAWNNFTGLELTWPPPAGN